MKVEFRNAQLETLYTTGKSRKYRLESEVVRKFVMVVGRLVEAEVVTDLWATPSLKFEKLQGFDHRYSARVNLQYRLEMEIDWEDPEKTFGIIGLVDLSNHYKG